MMRACALSHFRVAADPNRFLPEGQIIKFECSLEFASEETEGAAVKDVFAGHDEDLVKGVRGEGRGWRWGGGWG